jgi:hypothetical protein
MELSSNVPLNRTGGSNILAPKIIISQQVYCDDPYCVGSGQSDPYSVVYCSIQDAITDATAGDTIEVAAGTYTETVAVDEQVTLLGANQDVGPDKPRGGESVIDGMVKITADAVTVDGFKLTNSGIEISDASNSALNVKVRCNILENAAWADGAVDLNGGNRCDGGYIGYNTISGASGYGQGHQLLG